MRSATVESIFSCALIKAMQARTPALPGGNMKKIRRSLFCFFLLVVVAFHIFRQPMSAADSPSRFFPTKDLMRIGVYYYPEHWPQEQWDRDFAKMEELGFEFVHMVEF